MDLRCFSLLWLVILGSAPPADSQPPEVKPRYVKFLDQHFNLGMAEKKCNIVIAQRKISVGDTNNCKEKNTFVTARKDLLIGVCGKGGTRKSENRNLFESNQPFPVVICKLISGERHPKCEYRGVKSTRKVILACDGEWPVHYDEDIVVV